MRYAIPPLFLLLRIVGRREKKVGKSAWLARSGAPQRKPTAQGREKREEMRGECVAGAL